MRLFFIMCLCLACFSKLESQDQGLNQLLPPKESAEIRLNNCRILLGTDRQLASSQTGVVSKVHVREGDVVKKGQLLVELDVSIPEASLAVAQKEAENDVDVRYARIAAKVAEAEYELAVAANLDQPLTYSSIEIEKLRLEKERSLLQIEVAQHQFDLSELRQGEAQAVVESYKISSPADGLITRIFQHEGEAISAGTPALELKDASYVDIEAELGIHHYGNVKVGDLIRIVPPLGSIELTEDQYPKGKILLIDVSADPVSRTIRILAEADNSENLLLPGLLTEIIIMPSSKVVE